MSIRIAIPEPSSLDPEYNSRSFPSYLAALHSAGATPLVIPLDERQDRVAKLLANARGVLLPGCKFDLEPEAYGEERIPACNASDPGRAAVDELLLQDAFNLHKPILAICYGLQSLNVWRGGSLVQDLAAAGMTGVNHAPGRQVHEAHPVRVTAGSRLAGLVGEAEEAVLVNSSHHQAVKVPGDNLRVTAVSPEDGVIEAVELEGQDHYVVGVQWHPERSYTVSACSRALFAEFVREAEGWRPREVQESVVKA